MSEWLAWATYDPAPEEHAGYWGGTVWIIPPQVTPDKKHGVLWHSVYGYFTYVTPSAVMRSRGNSWDATILRDGRVWKHRKDPTWVNWHATGPAQNMMLVGVEMEGKDEPWTEAQWASWRRVVAETWAYFGWANWVKGRLTNRTQDDIRTAILSIGRGSNWNHGWVAATSCPNGRNDYARMGQEAKPAEPTQKGVNDVIFVRIKDGEPNAGAVYAVDGQMRWTPVTINEYIIMSRLPNIPVVAATNAEVISALTARGQQTDALVAALAAAATGGGGGATPKQFVDELKERL